MPDSLSLSIESRRSLSPVVNPLSFAATTLIYIYIYINRERERERERYGRVGRAHGLYQCRKQYLAPSISTEGIGRASSPLPLPPLPPSLLALPIEGLECIRIEPAACRVLLDVPRPLMPRTACRNIPVTELRCRVYACATTIAHGKAPK
jgi:hypothetical protein